MIALPQVLEKQIADDGALVTLLVSETGPWFDGHFAGQPILPGVVQIGWAVHFAAGLRSDDVPPMQLERVKFKRPIGPGARLTLRLTPVGDKVTYDYRLAQGPGAPSASSGVLRYGHAA